MESINNSNTTGIEVFPSGSSPFILETTITNTSTNTNSNNLPVTIQMVPTGHVSLSKAATTALSTGSNSSRQNVNETEEHSTSMITLDPFTINQHSSSSRRSSSNTAGNNQTQHLKRTDTMNKDNKSLAAMDTNLPPGISITGTNVRRIRRWRIFPGRNRFFCNGRIIMAKQISVFYFTLTLLVSTTVSFFIFE